MEISLILLVVDLLLHLARHIHKLFRGFYALPDTAFAVVGDPRWGRQIWLQVAHGLLRRLLVRALVLIKALDDLGRFHGLSGGLLP